MRNEIWYSDTRVKINIKRLNGQPFKDGYEI